MSATKPHEETWTAKLEPTFSENDLSLWMVLDAEGQLVADCTANENAARLLAQAPTMAREMLAFVEHVFDAPHDPSPEEVGKYAERMRDVLRAAGVLP